MMKSSELVNKAKEIATKFKTLYVMGCFGAPMTPSNKKRYTANHKYNKQLVRTQMINNATSDTFGFDCVNLIKGILWGWKGDKSKTYGGASYCYNDVPDIGADTMITYCKDVSTDFSDIVPGEFVWMKGHCGIYIGDKQVIESTPKWDNCVQISNVANLGNTAGKSRKWTKHGKLPWVDYSEVTVNSDVPSDYAKESWEKLKAAGATDGSNPKGNATREQIAVMLDRLGLIK